MEYFTCEIFDANSVGFHMEYSMEFPRNFTEFVQFHRSSMEFLWHGISMEFHGNSMELRGIPWKFHGVFHVKSNGVSMENFM